MKEIRELIGMAAFREERATRERPQGSSTSLGAGEQRGELRERLEETKGNIRGRGQISHRGTRTQDSAGADFTSNITGSDCRVLNKG